ncbi:MAG: hypothetical protein EOP49_31225 [Sphingobacteriales bacterium]|nr:MAG: hypothetical protein EOP49_31225 [Sphingobacteriales bacterium]
MPHTALWQAVIDTDTCEVKGEVKGEFRDKVKNKVLACCKPLERLSALLAESSVTKLLACPESGQLSSVLSCKGIAKLRPFSEDGCSGPTQAYGGFISMSA